MPSLVNRVKSTLQRPLQLKRKRIKQGVGQLLNLSLQQYQKQNKQYPDTIVIFRDGVGNSQINDLIEIELKAMKSVIQQTYNIKLPQFAYIVVNKRISDKFFSSNNENNGMIFPERVTSKEFDFFLIAQQVNQGTPIPTHYTVIENTTNWNEDTFWRFTYFQCFNYRNWSGPVKIPACLQNAHTVAYRVGEVIQSDAHVSLESLLYFYDMYFYSKTINYLHENDQLILKIKRETHIFYYRKQSLKLNFFNPSLYTFNAKISQLYSTILVYYSYKSYFNYSFSCFNSSISCAWS